MRQLTTLFPSDSDYFESLPPWRSVSVTGVAETAPSDAVDETIHINHYEFLEEHAEELGAVERDCKLQVPAFVWAFVFGFAAGENRTLAGFRRCDNSTADETISPGGFYQQLTPTPAEYLRDLVETALDEVAVPNGVDADLNRLRDVMIVGGTVLRLHEFLSDQFEARHEEQAGAKLHLLHNATE
jgi:putative transposase